MGREEGQGEEEKDGEQGKRTVGDVGGGWMEEWKQGMRTEDGGGRQPKGQQRREGRIIRVEDRLSERRGGRIVEGR
ncbi:hypothetical protein ACHWQZ_G008044 [Mnemiopsis leidyi]